MTQTALEELISKNQNLSEEEKREWLSLLPEMSKEQISELLDVLLQSAVSVPELSESKPLLEITEPSEVLEITTAETQKQIESPVSQTPIVNSKVPETTVIPVKATPVQNISTPVPSESASKAKAFVKTEPTPEPLEETQAPTVQQSPGSFNTAPSTPNVKFQEVSLRPKNLSPLFISSLEQLSSLTFESFLKSDLTTITSSIFDLSNKFGYRPTRAAIEKSPLYKTYLSYGLSALSNQTLKEQIGHHDFEDVIDILRLIRH